MKPLRTMFFVVGLLTLSTASLSAQVATGMPVLGTFSNNTGPETIDLANLNVHLTIPMLNKAGRGTNFRYNVSYDSSVWYPVTSGSSVSWQPASALWGWTSDTSLASGWVGIAEQHTVWYAGVHPCYSNYYYYTYYDVYGSPHPFPGDTEVDGPNNYYCGGGYYPDDGDVTTDGSGYTIYVGGSPNVVTVYSKNGKNITPDKGAAAASFTDRNGNIISSDTSGHFYDTLSSTTPTLTVSGSGTPSSPTVFTYTAPSGASASYTMKYGTFTVQTNFGCSNISEFPGTSEYLVTEIDLPDYNATTNPNARYTFTYEGTYQHSGNVTGRLASVTEPTGGTVTYTYSTNGTNGIVCADGSASYLTRQTPDTGSNHWLYTHSESGTAWTTTITDPSSNQNQTVMNFQRLYLTEQQTYLGSTSGTLLKTIQNCYNNNTTNCNTTAITLPITQITNTVTWPAVGTLSAKSATTKTTYDNYGDLTEKDEYDYGASTPTRKTLITYATLGNNIKNQPYQITVEDGSSNIKSQVTITYDQGSVSTSSGTPQHTSVSGSRGNPTTVTALVSGTNTLSETFTYWDTGNVNVFTDVNSAQYTVGYGGGSCINSFPTSVSEPLSSMSQSFTWNCTGGVKTSATDESGNQVSFGYTSDPYFWRPNSVTDQLTNVTTLAYTDTTTESTLSFNGTSSVQDILSTVDGFGRPHIQQVKEGPSSSTYDSVETDYDVNGNQDRRTLPYAGTKGQTNSSAAALTWTFDSLGRKTQSADSGGRQTNFTFTQNDTYRDLGPHPTGENDKRSNYEYDALGRLASVCEVTSLTGNGTCAQTSSQTGYWTKYTYDVNNRVTGVAQNAQSSVNSQTRTYAYDGLGRMTSETNPETGNSAVTYTYDSDSTCGTSKGDLVKKTDPEGDTICVAYDSMHRPTSVTYSGGYASSTPQKHFVYDSATVNSVVMANVKNRLANAYTCFSPCSPRLTDLGISYTKRGEVSDVYQETPHSGGYYHVNQSYWVNGAPDVLSGLSALPTITYNVDPEGRTSTVSASSGQNPVTSASYNTASLATAVGFGSSDSDGFQYDPNTNRMTQYSFNVNNQSETGVLTWNAIGTLAKLLITDPFNSSNAQTCTYAHDDLSRIASVSCTSTPAWAQTFTYDAYGNINKSGNSSFNPAYSTGLNSTNHMTQIGSSTPTYDPNGNVTNDFLHSYAWDANGRPVTIDTVTATYDALGRMVEQTRSGPAYTEIVYAPSGAKLALMTGLSTLQKGYVPLPGGTMAVYNSSGLAYYRHADWVGSSRLASTPSRTVYFDGSYAPFGEAYASIGTTDLSFTGMNQDTVANLYDFPGREYGIQGRWPSPDPAGLSAVFLKDPQTLNRYAYVRNSPLGLIDPEGYCPAPTDTPQTKSSKSSSDTKKNVCDAIGGALAYASIVVIPIEAVPNPVGVALALAGVATYFACL